MIIPHNINTESIETHRFDHQNSMLPILNRYSRIMYFSSIDFRILLRIEAAGINIGLKRLIPTTVMQISCHTGEEDKKHRRYGSIFIDGGWD